MSPAFEESGQSPGTTSETRGTSEREGAPPARGRDRTRPGAGGKGGGVGPGCRRGRSTLHRESGDGAVPTRDTHASLL